MHKEKPCANGLTRLRRSAILPVVEPATDLLSTSEAAELLGCSVASVNRYAASGRLAIAKQLTGIRGARFYLRTDVYDLRDDLARRAS